jgi:hypothetical protein
LDAENCSVSLEGEEHWSPNWFARLGFTKIGYQLHGILKGRSDDIDHTEKEVVFRWIDGNEIISPELDQKQIDTDYEVVNEHDDPGQEGDTDSVQSAQSAADSSPSDEGSQVHQPGLRETVGEDSIPDQRPDLGGGSDTGGVLVHSSDLQTGQADSLEAIETLWQSDVSDKAE